MIVQPAPITALRPASGAEIVDAGVQIARRHYAALVMAALVPLLPYFAMDVWTSASGREPDFWTMLLYGAVWASLADAAAGRVALDVLEGRASDPARAIGATLRRAWPVILSGLYRATVGTLGLVVLIVPGLYVFSTYALIPVLPVLEPGLGAWRSLKRSAALTRRARGLAFGTYVVPYIFVFGATLAVSAFVEQLGSAATSRMISGFAGSSVAVLLTPFVAAIQVRLYLELRMRKEASDIEWALAAAEPRERSAEIAGSPPGTAPL